MSDQALNVDYAAAELRYNAFMLPAYRSALAALNLGSGMHVLDVGCGPGGLFPLLGEAVGPYGRITGIDGSQAHLDAAEDFARQQGVQTPLTLVQADLRQPLDFANHTFNSVWCADVLWANLFPNPVTVVHELARVVKPGGAIAIFFGNFYRALYQLSFCFIYKFRQRFAVVAKAIGDRLHLDTDCLEEYRAHQMYLDDLACCTSEGCAC